MHAVEANRMNAKHVDVTIHVDETLTETQLTDLEGKIRAKSGVLDVTHQQSNPHLMVAEYDPDRVNSSDLLKIVEDNHLHGELIGL